MKPEDNMDEIKQVVYDYSGILKKISFTYLKNTHDAEDIVQDVFITYLTKHPDFSCEEHRRNWLIRCTINKCKDLLRSFWHKKCLPISEELEYLMPEETEILQLIWKLEDKYRIPLYLHYCMGYSINEISAMLNKKPATVGTLLARARKKLKVLLAQKGDYYVE